MGAWISATSPRFLPNNPCPMGLLVKSDDGFVADHAAVTGLDELTWEQFVTANLVPVTIGNIVGGALMVGAIYWFVYLRGAGESSQARPGDD